MCKHSPKSGLNRIDPCMRPLIKWLNANGWETCGSCCGHSVYRMSIVVKTKCNGKPCYYELLSDTLIPRTKRFYKRDKNGKYFIPECVK